MSEGEDATLPDTRALHTDPVPRVSATDLGERYEVGPVLGKGGMGEVRLARDLRIDREVAVKLLRAPTRDEQTLGRFFREARVQGVLEHPAVVPVHDMGIDPDGNPYFVMKRLAGTNLHDVIAAGDRARWPRRTLLARLIDVCLAVEFAHTRGVIHRDLKPANIMLGDFGEAYVLDWGLARIAEDGDSFRGVAPLSGDDHAAATVAGDLLGTPGYMSPEQARGESVDWRTDVFGLGCVLYEILAGVPALPRGIAAIALTVSTAEHRPSARAADVPVELDDLCAHCTAADAKQRPRARELAERLQAYLDGDRDVARRKQLADEAVAAARTALAGGGDEGRATAMREAARALALEPAHPEGQELLASLMFDLPDTIPAEAMAAADAERARMRQRMFVKAAYGYLLGIPLLSLLFLLPVRHAWPIVFGLASVTAITGISFYLARRPLSMSSPWLLAFLVANTALITTSGLLLGALLLLPVFVIGSLSAILSQPSTVNRWLIVAVHLLPLAVILGLELGGVMPRSFAVEHGTLAFHPYALDLSPEQMLLVFGLGVLIQLGSTLDIQSAFRAATVDAQNRVYAQRWHLEKVLPKR